MRKLSKEKKRTKFKAAMARARAWGSNFANALARREKRTERALEIDPHGYAVERERLINAMTNWQRNQWGRAGHPQDRDALLYYVNLPHWKQRTT